MILFHDITNFSTTYGYVTCKKTSVVEDNISQCQLLTVIMERWGNSHGQQNPHLPNCFLRRLKKVMCTYRNLGIFMSSPARLASMASPFRPQPLATVCISFVYSSALLFLATKKLFFSFSRLKPYILHYGRVGCLLVCLSDMDRYLQQLGTTKNLLFTHAKWLHQFINGRWFQHSHNSTYAILRCLSYPPLLKCF